MAIPLASIAYEATAGTDRLRAPPHDRQFGLAKPSSSRRVPDPSPDHGELHELLTVEDVAALFKVSRNWVYEHTRSRGTAEQSACGTSRSASTNASTRKQLPPMIAAADRGRACLTTMRLFGDVRPSGEIMQLLRAPERRNSGRALER